MAITATGVAPTSVPSGGLVTVTGTGFSGTTTAVLFNGVAGTKFTVVNATTITVVTPLMSAATGVTVVVVDSTGNVTVSGGITILATTYVINPLELPSNQTAAALFTSTSQGIVDNSKTLWCSSPFTTPNWQNQVGTTPGTGGAQASTDKGAVSVGWPDVTIADRTACAQVSLAVEQARLQTRTDNLTQDIASITAVP